jgi:outer membrane protein assembly factor BamB
LRKRRSDTKPAGERDKPAGFSKEIMMNRWKFAAFGLLLLGVIGPVALGTARQGVGKTEPRSQVLMFGGTPQRNMVNTVDKNMPIDWSVEDGKRKNIKWIADLGSYCYGGPIIADGKVFVGTNNANPRDKSVKGLKAVLMAFRESDGEFLWQIVHGSPNGDSEIYRYGLCSTPTFEDKRLYYVTPGCEVICADTAGKIQWQYDMAKELNVVAYHLANCSPLIVGDLVMVCTSNGRDEEGNLPSPKAPSFIAVNKNTGKLVWQSSLPGNKIIEGQWSNPTLASVNGKPQVIFAGGDCVIYALEPEKGDLIWKCNCNPIPRMGNDINPYIIATPVVVGDRLYVGLGIHPDNGRSLPYSHFLCLDITKKGDASPKSLDAKDPANKNSALVWAFGGEIKPPPKKGSRNYFGKTMSTAAIQDDLIYICEEIGLLHCLDAKTGQRYWHHDFREYVWGSAYWVDGKVCVGTKAGDVVLFAHGKERKYYCEGKLHVSKSEKDSRPVASMDDQIESTPVVAGGVLYIASKSKLFAIANGK